MPVLAWFKRHQFLTLAVLAALVAAAGVAVSMAGQGPAGVANKFVAAARSGKNIEAGGYLVGDAFSGPEGSDTGDVARLLPSTARPDFTLDQQSDTTAKVVSSSDKRDYMLLNKDQGSWRITEIGYFTDKTDDEPIPFQTDTSDDPNMFEGDSKTTQDGQDGEGVFRTTTKLVNGESSQVSRVQVSVKRRPVDEQVSDGTRSMATGKAVTYSDSSGDDFTLTITKVERNNFYGGDTLELTTHIVNNSTDSPLTVDRSLELAWPGSEQNGTKWVGGFCRAPGETGLVNDHSIDGGSSGDFVFDWGLRPGSSLRADITSVDDFRLGVEGWAGDQMQIYGLNKFWIGPIESGGPASSAAGNGN